MRKFSSCHPDIKDTNPCLQFEDNFIPRASITDSDGLNVDHSVALNLLSHVGTGVDVIDGGGLTDWCADIREDMRRGYQRCQTITVTSDISNEHGKVSSVYSHYCNIIHIDFIS